MNKKGLTYLFTISRFDCSSSKNLLPNEYFFLFLQIRLPNHVGYILEYLVRFVIRLHLNPQQVECLMMRFVAALTHQCVDILGEYFF